jgi:ABC-2 type transport system ATP-binding protein
VIHAQGLTKTFHVRAGTVEAVRGIDLDVSPEEIVGFLGPNGAGKTTTQRLLTTLLEPTAGSATVARHDLRREPVQVRRNIGYVAQGGSAASEARAGEELVDQARLYGIDATDARARAAALLAQLDLEGTAERQVKTFSGGQRRRLDIALGLIHSPPLLFLDEPTAGLDPQARANLWRHITALRASGTTVFLTTHYLEEADTLCDRVMVIDEGAIVAQGTPEELKRGIGSDSVTLTLADAEQGRLAEGAIAAAGRPASKIQLDGGTLHFQLPAAGEALPSVFDALSSAGVHVAGVEVRSPTLDDVFLSLTGRALRDESVAA